MNSFTDTNVFIAYVFGIDPLNNKANSFFNQYNIIFQSYFVKNECNNVFKRKKKILIKFFKNLERTFNEDNFHDFSLNNLEIYVKNKYGGTNYYPQIRSSLVPFWDNYVCESFPSYEVFEKAISQCIYDLNRFIYKRKEFWDSKTIITEQRKDSYSDLCYKLHMCGVHHPDDKIVLDAHYHNLNYSYDLDFITFDDDFFTCVSQISDFSFNSVKGKYDFF